MRTLILIIIMLCAFGLSSSAQTTFLESSLPAGLSHQVMMSQYMGGGAAFFDYNNDGFEDIYITGGEARDALYENNGDGTFTDISLSAGLGMTSTITTAGVVTGDIDRDGDRDIFVSTWYPFPNLLFINNNDGTFTESAQAAGITEQVWSSAAAFGDLNLDGHLDLYVANYIENWVYVLDSATQQPIGYDHDCFPNTCYLNNGNGTFTEIALSAGIDNGNGCGLITTLSDFDQDHDPDILIGNDFGNWIVPNSLYQNQFPLANTYSDLSQPSNFDAAIFCMGVAIADYDHDSDLDYYFTNLGRNVLLNNQGNASFLDQSEFALVPDTFQNAPKLSSGWGTAFLDFDNDSWPDLYCANGFVPTESFVPCDSQQFDRLFHNLGNGTFEEVSQASGISDPGVNRGVAVADYDNDGDMDLLVVAINDGGIQSGQRVRLYKNNSQPGSNHWIQVRLQGMMANLDGFGALIEMSAGGEKWVHEVAGGSSFGSQNSSIAHFGLGNSTVVDSLAVIWPGGRRQVLYNTAADQMVVIVEDTTAVGMSEPGLAGGLVLEVLPSVVTERAEIRCFLPVSGEIGLSVVAVDGSVVWEREMRQKKGWNSVAWEAKLSEGLYWVVLRAGEKRVFRRILVLGD